VFLNEFLVGFGDDRSVAERIINNASVEPHRVVELIHELSQLYLQKFPSEDPGKCGTAIFYFGYLRFLPMFDIRELLATSEIEQSNSNRTASTASTLSMSMSEGVGNIVMGSTTQSNVQDTDSPAGMILDTSNVAMGLAPRDRNIVQGTIASLDMIEGTSDDVMGSTTRASTEAADRGNDDASAARMITD
jgi:hypothetical protein